MTMNSNDLKNESIAYALAAGMVTFGSSAEADRDAERSRRRARLLRTKK